MSAAINPRLATVPRVVLDTNVLLDLWVFDDPRTRRLRAQLDAGALIAVRSSATLAEWRDVLARPQFGLGDGHQAALATQWSALAVPAADTQASPLRCRDPDDQPFLDLAATAGAGWLLTRDRALLALAPAAQALGLVIAPPERGPA